MNPLLFINTELGCEVRTALVDGCPVFVGLDVCDALGLTKYRDALASLDEDEGCPVVVDTLGGRQEMSGVTESGLYALIFQSRKPAAKKFRKWVTSEVLPAIRRHGFYLLAGEVPVESIRVCQLEIQLRAAKLNEQAAFLRLQARQLPCLRGSVPIHAWLKANRPGVTGTQLSNLVRQIKRWAEQQGLPQGREKDRGVPKVTLLPEHIAAFFAEDAPAEGAAK